MAFTEQGKAQEMTLRVKGGFGILNALKLSDRM
jgi:hypothetical protein